MNRNRLLVVAVLLCAATFAPANVSAQTATANLSVTANVAANCTISTTTVAFGSYDPVVANLATTLDSTGGVTITCTKGSVPTIALGLGANSLAGARRMLGAVGEYLTYELYHPGGYVTVWGTAGANLFTAGAAPNKNARSFTVNGRVAANQDVAVGNYTDTVLATVNF